MDRAQIVIALLGSAAVGALVSSIISVVAQHLDRKARRQELLLKEALDLAQWRLDLGIKNAENMHQRIDLKDKIVLAEDYYHFLEHLLKHGKLPDDPRIQRQLPD